MTLGETVDRLRVAAQAVADLGLSEETTIALGLLEKIDERLGFAGDAYVLALAGGTGVGKSSVLNALAGETVSPAGARRPITDEPLAWVNRDDLEEVRPLLEWLTVDRVVEHEHPQLNRVAILDLPDVDSVRIEHRARVDALLPLIDAVVWVVDAEKYDDERLHSYLRNFARHSPRMRFIFNKADRLDSKQRQVLVADLKRRLADDGMEKVPINSVSALTGFGVETLRAELARAADTKAIVADKLATDAASAVDRLAAAAGIKPPAYQPLLSPAERRVAIGEAVDGALSLVDMPGVTRRVQAAVHHQARRRGGSLLARVVEFFTVVTGHRRRLADPGAYLPHWRQRGSIGHILNPLRSAMVRAASAVPPASRSMILSAFGADSAEKTLTQALDQSTGRAASGLRIPNSVFWSVLGALQLAVGAVLVFSVVWYVLLTFGPSGMEVSEVEIPVLGPLPMPLVLLAGSLSASGLFSILLRLHAGWIGARLGRMVESEVRTEVEEVITRVGFGDLDRVEAARGRLAEAAFVIRS